MYELYNNSSLFSPILNYDEWRLSGVSVVIVPASSGANYSVSTGYSTSVVFPYSLYDPMTCVTGWSRTGTYAADSVGIVTSSIPIYN